MRLSETCSQMASKHLSYWLSFNAEIRENLFPNIFLFQFHSTYRYVRNRVSKNRTKKYWICAKKVSHFPFE